MKPYGTELIIDLYGCDVSRFYRANLDRFFAELCELLDMEQCDRHFWDYFDDPDEYDKAPDHLKGISAIQFISTSNITIHTLDVLERVYLNIFTCKELPEKKAVAFCIKFFDANTWNHRMITRQ